MLVLKSITYTEDSLSLDAYSEELSEAQKLRQQKIDEELQKMNNIIDQMVKQTGVQVLYQGELCNALQMTETLPLVTGTKNKLSILNSVIIMFV